MFLSCDQRKRKETIGMKKTKRNDWKGRPGPKSNPILFGHASSNSPPAFLYFRHGLAVVEEHNTTGSFYTPKPYIALHEHSWKKDFHKIVIVLFRYFGQQHYDMCDKFT